MQGYERDPRSLAKRAEAYLKSTGIADGALFGPENEFFIFDSVRWNSEHERLVLRRSTPCKAPGISNTAYDGRQQGPSPRRQGRLLPGAAGRCASRTSAPRCAMRSKRWASKVEVHHHEVATGGQCEIGVGPGDAGEEGRRGADPQVRHPQRRAQLRQDRHLHAEAARRRQRLRHARAPVAAEGRQEPVRRRRVRRPVGDRAVLHRRHHQARQGASTPSPTPAPTATSAWCPASRRR